MLNVYKMSQKKENIWLHAEELWRCLQSIPDFCLLPYFQAEQKQKLKWNARMTHSRSVNLGNVLEGFFFFSFVEIYTGDLCNSHKAAHKGRDDWAAFLFSFPPCGCCGGTNVPVRGTMDCAAVTCQEGGTFPTNNTITCLALTHICAHARTYAHILPACVGLLGKKQVSVWKDAVVSKGSIAGNYR